jgi:propanol-preferring alcohol dehydrogenase
VVLKRLAVRGSVVGTRLDTRDVLAFAADGHVRATLEYQPLDAIGAVFARRRRGDVNGRVVLRM